MPGPSVAGRTAVAVAATLVSAGLYALAFPPIGWWPVAWVALVPLLLALRTGSARRALGLAWLWTVVAAWGVGSWFPRAIADYYAQPYTVGLAFFFGVATLTAAVDYQVFALAYRRLRGGRPYVGPLLVAAAWTAAELGRARLLGGDPWALLGYSQLPFAPLVQVAELTGVYGPGFCVVATNAALAECATAWARGPAGWRTARPGLAGALLTSGAALGWGALRLVSADAGDGPPTRVAVVQGNVPVSGQWNPEHYGRNLDVYLSLTARALSDARPALVVWPESAMTFFLEAEPAYRRAIAAVTGTGGVELIAGGPHAAGGGGFHNAAFLLAADGTVAGRYDKRLLLPFGEYFPLAALDVMRRRFAGAREFVAGQPSPPLPTAAGPAGVVVCNEAFFPGPAATRVREGATWLLTLANDSWTGDPRFAAMAFDMARLRAIEERRWLVRASTWGPSGFVDAAGRVTAVSATGVAAVVTGSVHGRSGRTAYALLGDVFAGACALLAFAAALGRRGTPAGRAPAARIDGCQGASA